MMVMMMVMLLIIIAAAIMPCDQYRSQRNQEEEKNEVLFLYLIEIFPFSCVIILNELNLASIRSAEVSKKYD
jgi:hypothetical protein